MQSPPEPDSRPPRTVAVVGATGQLGRVLVEAFAAAPGWTVRSLGHQDVEIADPQSVARALDPLPAVVVNSTLGDWSRQDDADLALRVNALGPRLLAERCAAGGALLVHVSTDFVFDGEASEPYRESDRTEPRTVYGITKLAGEQLVRAALPRHLIVRVAYLFGPGGSRAKRGSNIVTWLLESGRSGRPLTLVADQTFSPTYAPDAAAPSCGWWRAARRARCTSPTAGPARRSIWGGRSSPRPDSRPRCGRSAWPSCPPGRPARATPSWPTTGCAGRACRRPGPGRTPSAPTCPLWYNLRLRVIDPDRHQVDIR